MSPTFAEKLKAAQEAQRKRYAEKAVATVSTDDYSDLIPDVDIGYQRTEADDQIDRAVASISFVDAYNTWIGKMQATDKLEDGNKVSCPWPGHADRHPSAQFNRSKKTFHCHSCERGGDIYDIAAVGLGYDVDNYKTDGTFPKLKTAMAEHFGYTVRRSIDGNTEVTAPTVSTESDNSGDSDNDTVAVQEESDSEVVQLHEEDDIELLPTFDWKLVTEPNSFLDYYMQAATVDDIPEMYHFFGGAMLALGLAAGRNKCLEDEPSVKPNLFVCLVGESGSGKSKSAGFMEMVVEKVMPFDPTDPSSNGTQRIISPSSAEALIARFDVEMIDPVTYKPNGGKIPIRGLVEYDELSSLMGKSGRQGSVLKPVLMQFYDCRGRVETHSVTGGHRVAKHAYASVLTTTQPASLGRLLSGEDATSGFINRWLFISGEKKRRFARNKIQYDIRKATVALSLIFNWTNRDDEMIGWTDAADAAWDDFFHAQVEKDRTTSPALGRIDLLCKKLILLFSLNEMHSSVEVSSVEKLKLIYPYLLECYGTTSDKLGMDLAAEIEQEVLRNLDRPRFKARGMTPGDLNSYIKNKKYPINLVARVLESLIKLEIVKLEAVKGKRGPASKRYFRAS